LSTIPPDAGRIARRQRDSPAHASSAAGMRRGLPDQEGPGRAVQEEIEPVDRPHELPSQEHPHLLDEVGHRHEGGEPEARARDHDHQPGQALEPARHRYFSISECIETLNMAQL
jgi:hypothetical protein